MDNNHEHDGEDELQAARRTAHALGQTEGAEKAEVAAELAASPQARQEVEAVEALAARLKEAAREAPQPEPSPTIREAIERRLAELEPAAGRAAAAGAARPWWRSRLATLALTAACLVALAVPIVWSTGLLGPGKERKVASGSADRDAAITPSHLPETFDSFDIGGSNESATTEMDRDPTLHKPRFDDVEVNHTSRNSAPSSWGAAGGSSHGDATKDSHVDGDDAIAHYRKDVEINPADARARLGATAFGPGPTLPGATGTGVALGTGRDPTTPQYPTMVDPSAGPAAKPYDNYQPPSGYSPWMNLYQPTNNGTISPYTAYVQPALKQQNFNPRAGETNFTDTPQKPLETWKPAHVVPNSSRLMVGDKEELALKGMQVDVRVDSFRARVLIDLYYFNDRPQQLEGNFQLRLPDEASPYFFAFGRTVYQAPQVTANDSMFFKPQQVSQGDTTPEKILALRGNSWEQPKVARMVPREKAALAYRDTVRRRIDPALVEWSGAGVFQCRVFPLAPHSLHRVTIGYDVDLFRVGDDLELRLDLPGQTPATIVDLNIAASDARQVSLDAPATVLNPASPGANAPDSPSRLSYRLIDPKDRPLVVRLRKPGTQMLVGTDEPTGSYFATRVGLTLPETPAANRAKQAVFLVDTSLSAGPQFLLWTKLLRATLENNRDSIHEFAVLFFNVETFWWQEKFVANTPENVDALLNYADGLALEGATDLGRALKEAASPAWLKKAGGPAPDLFLLSDGAATWGEDRWALLAKPLTPEPVGWDQRAGHHVPMVGERRPTNDIVTTVGRRRYAILSHPTCYHRPRTVRLSHGPGRWRSAAVGLSGRADGRGGLLAGG